jgi:hypothetical protein
MPSPKSAETSVVKFPAKTPARMPRTEATERPNHPDADLIKACMAYASAIAGTKAAFDVDPTGDSDFAQPLDERALRAAHKNQHLAANCSPSTIDGLRAKAAVVEMILETETDADSVKPFLKSLADDIERLCKGITR